MALDTTADQELQAKKAKDAMSSPELMVHASKRSGRSAFKIAREAMKLSKGRGKISLHEYVRYRLYDNDRYSEADKERFIGALLHWPMVSEVCDRTWDAATEDKWLADTILRAGGCPVPDTVAVIDATGRRYGPTPVLTGADALKIFLTSAPLPLFGKVQRGVASLGAFIIEAADDTHIHLSGQGPMTYDAFLADMVEDNQYVLQNVVQNHSFFDPFTDHCATLRMVTMVRGDDVFIPNVVLKLAAGGNLADAFWRPGNIACNVDPATGEISSIKTQGLVDIVDHPTHPENGAKMIGLKIPLWDDLCAVTRDTARTFAPVRYGSLDLALTENGPVVIEFNTGGGWDIIQNVTGEGFMTDEVTQTFRDWGCTLY